MIPSPESRPSEPVRRSVALDQLRGYAIAGMIFVNFLGMFDLMPEQLKHHRIGMTYADTIAPLFIFVVGMGFRLSLQRRMAKVGPWRARRSALMRYLLLTAIGIVFYGPDYRASWWDALTDIGLGGVLSLPFIERAATIRICAAAAYLAFYQAVFSLTGYGAWQMAHSINGGPVGPFSWASILLIGTIGWDLLASGRTRRIVGGSVLWGLLLTSLGWLLRAPWGEVKGLWPFTQFGMTAPYPLFSAGLCFFTLAAAHWLTDVARLGVPTLTVLGRNALVIYLIHATIIESNRGYFTREDPVWKALLGFVFLYALCYAAARKLHNDGVIIKL